MATGKRAFRNATAAQTLAAIVQDEPEPIAGLNQKLPAPLRWIVERCLAKEPRGRYASTDDLARDLARVRAHLSEVSGSGETARYRQESEIPVLGARGRSRGSARLLLRPAISGGPPGPHPIRASLVVPEKVDSR